MLCVCVIVYICRLDALNHFGGGAGDMRTKKQVMEEIIMKSKMHKMERQQKLGEQRSMVSDLDGDFGSLLHRLGSGGLEVKEKGEDTGGADDFFLEARRMANQIRERATDRLKSKEEIAVEQATMLKKLESERLRRMKGLPSAESEDEGEASDAVNDETLDGNVKIDKRFRHQKENQEEEEEEEYELTDDSEEEWESGESGEEDEVMAQFSSKRSKIATAVFRMDDDAVRALHVASTGEPNTEDLPFTFACPDSYTQLTTLLNRRSLKDQATIISRIRVCHSPKITPANFPKMVAFYGLVWDRVFLMGRQLEALWGAEGGLDMARFSAEMDMLTSVVCEMSEACPRVASVVMRDRLTLLRATVMQRGKFLTGSELLLVKLVANVFPTTDHRHHVTVPAFHFLAECLVRLPVRSARDVVCGLYAVSLLHDFVQDSEKFIPEVFAFLQSVLDGWLNQLALRDPHPVAVNVLLPNMSSQFAAVAHTPTPDTSPLSFSLLFAPSASSSAVFAGQAFLSQAVTCAVGLISDLRAKYADLPSFPEAFAGLARILEQLSRVASSKPPKKKKEKKAVEAHPLLDLIAAECDALTSAIAACVSARRPLLQKVEAKSIQQLVPAYVEDFRPDKLDHNTEKDAMKRLAKKLKREKKGAIKEIKKDAQMIAHARLQKQLRDDQTRVKKTNAIRNELDGAQRDSNIMAGKKKATVLKKDRQAKNKARTYRRPLDKSS